MKRTAWTVLIVAGLAALAVSLAAAQAGGYGVNWHVVAGGGGAASAGSGYAVAGSIGQAAPGQAGGGAVVVGGFWALPLATLPPPPGADYVLFLAAVQR